jgi:predicted transcriptional regulator
MKNIDLEHIKADYEILFCGKVQDFVIKRKNLGITQFQMARKLGKSLSTIQNFERYGCKDAFLLFGYKKILS